MNKYCMNCWGTGKVPDFWDETKNIICPRCNGSGKEPQQTNEEWFCSLSTEEKAMAIVLCCPYEINWFGENFEKRMEQRMKNLSQSAQGYGLGIQKIKEWLKQPHEHKGD